MKEGEGMKDIPVKQLGWLSEFEVLKSEGSKNTIIVFTEGANDGNEVRILLSEYDTKRLRRKLNWSLSLNPKKKRVRR